MSGKTGTKSDQDKDDENDDDFDEFDEEADALGQQREPGAPVKLKMSEILFAYRDDSPDNAYYLDTESGAIKYVNKNLIDLRDLTDEIERERWRFKYIPKPDSKQMPSDLREFHRTVADSQLANVLSMAFESPHVLSSFKKILEKNAGEQTRLNQFLDNLHQERIKEWLRSNFIEHEFIAEP